MIRIGITQRVDDLPDRGERRDALDQRWSRLLQRLGAVAVPLPNLAEPAGALIAGLGLHGVVLSGGNDLAAAPGARDVAPERDRTEFCLIAACLQDGVPLLGVCRGMQAINVHLGGRLERRSGHVRTRHLLTVVGEPEVPIARDVNSYHDVVITGDGLAPGLAALATAEDGTVEAMVHREARCFGVMWHPERETPPAQADLALLRRALDLPS